MAVLVCEAVHASLVDSWRNNLMLFRCNGCSRSVCLRFRLIAALYEVDAYEVPSCLVQKAESSDGEECESSRLASANMDDDGRTHSSARKICRGSGIPSDMGIYVDGGSLCFFDSSPMACMQPMDGRGLTGAGHRQNKWRKRKRKPRF